MRLLLVTGFLGAGKTTFLKRLLKRHEGERLALIVNEFGRVNVDGMMLSGLGATLQEVTGGSAFCACRLDQFEDALRRACAEQPDLILVEASGLSDPTAVRTVVARVSGVEYAGCVALCDAPRVEKALSTLQVCLKQLAVSDLILLNKADLVTEAQADRLTALLSKRFPRARIERTVQGDFQPGWLDHLQSRAQTVPYEDTRDITLQKVCVTVAPTMTLAEMNQFLRLLAEETYRMKGVVRLAEGTFLIDCVGTALSVTPYGDRGNSGELVAIAGEGMNLRKAVKEAQAWYPDKVESLAFG